MTPQHALVEQQKAHFDRVADMYHTARQHSNHRLLKELIWGEFFRHMPPMPPGEKLNVLEPMCGLGEGHDILAARTNIPFGYKGFDYSSTVVARAQRERPQLNIVQQDVTQFRAGEMYDIIIVIGGLHHVPHACAESVHRLTQSLKPGGLFISHEPTHGNGLFRRVREFIYRHNALFDERTERGFSVAELFSAFEAAGLKRRHACHPGLLAYIFYFNPDAFPKLNRGGVRAVRACWRLDKYFIHTRLGRFLSFSTVSVWQKP